MLLCLGVILWVSTLIVVSHSVSVPVPVELVVMPCLVLHMHVSHSEVHQGQLTIAILCVVLVCVKVFVKMCVHRVSYRIFSWGGGGENCACIRMTLSTLLYSVKPK